jgi:hypothetical protein
MAVNETVPDPKTEAELEAHLADFLAKGAGLEDVQEDVQEELARLELYDADAAPSGAPALGDDDVFPQSDRKYWNVRDAAAKRGCEPQELAEWLLRERKAKWDQAAKAQRVRDSHVRQADAWLSEEKKPFQRFDGFAQFALAEYVGDFHPGEKTVKLIAGALKTTAVADKVVWDDGAALIEVICRIVGEVNGVPLEASDLTPEALALAQQLISGYSKSAMKEGLDCPKGKRTFYNADGEAVGYVAKVAPPPGETTRFAISQEGVGGKVIAEDEG